MSIPGLIDKNVKEIYEQYCALAGLVMAAGNFRRISNLYHLQGSATFAIWDELNINSNIWQRTSCPVLFLNGA